MKFLCNSCGYESLKWEGKCSSCGEWGSLQEFKEVEGKEGLVKESAKGFKVADLEKSNAKNIKSRLSSGFEEFDRVLGGGFVRGQVVLLAGEPGVGKSTLLLQTALNISNKNKVVYFSA